MRKSSRYVSSGALHVKGSRVATIAQDGARQQPAAVKVRKLGVQTTDSTYMRLLL